MDPRALAELAADPSRLDDLPEEELADVVAELERLKAKAWTRLHQPPAGNGDGTSEPSEDRMLDVEEAAELLSVKPRWLYDRSDDLPFAKKLAPRTLRFSERGLYRWLDTRP